MTTNAVVVAHPGDTSLSISSEQATFNDAQVAALRHMGVEGAAPGDLEVFFHVVKRTGLDPFARQIHMIGRNTKNQKTNQWETKYTIQTGIDGYRLIGRRAADRARADISVSAPEWAHEDGTWRPLWTTKWGNPVAARVTIKRGGSPFTGVAIFDEYAQTKRDGGLTQMWSQRPAGQIAKCAEALAWRMAFPQDLAGVYVDDEMHQADSRGHEKASFPQTYADTGEAADDDAVADLVALMDRKGIPEADRLSGAAFIVGRDVASLTDLTVDEVAALTDRLDQRADAEQAGDPS